MSVKFIPTGTLDLATDPMLLPEEGDGKNSVSGAMSVCRNISIDRTGIARTRAGCSSIYAVPGSGEVSELAQLEDDWYTFSSTGIYRNGETVSDIDTRTPWSAVVHSPLSVETQSLFAACETRRLRIDADGYYQWGIDAPEEAPTITRTVPFVYAYDWEHDAITGTGRKFTTDSGDYEATWEWESQQLDGESDPRGGTTVGMYWFEATGTDTDAIYSVCYTYCRKNGDTLECESNPSPTAETSVVSGLGVTWVDSTDSQVTHVRIYRSLADMGAMYYDSEYDVDDLQAYLSKTNEQLGTEVESDHDRPPEGIRYVYGPLMNGTLFAGVANKLYFSRPNLPEYWPSDNYVVVSAEDDPIQAITSFNGQVYVCSQREVYSIQGTSATSFFPYPMRATTGTASRECFLAVKGYGIFHLGYDGIYLFSGDGDSRTSRFNIDPLFRGETVGEISPINTHSISRAWFAAAGNTMHFGIPQTTNPPTDVLVVDLDLKRTTQHRYTDGMWLMRRDSADNALLAAATGKLIRLGVGIDDDGVDIEWAVESKHFSSLRKYFPRTARYDTVGTAIGTIKLDGIVRHQHSVTTVRNPRKRLITGCTGNRLSLRLEGDGVIEIHSMEVE